MPKRTVRTGKRWVSKERGLELYGKGKDLYGREFRVQDGSWACFKGIRIYGHNSDNEGTEICLSLKADGVKCLIKALQKTLITIDR